MSRTEDTKIEQEIAFPLRASLIFIKRNVLSYQSDNLKLQKLQTKLIFLDSEAKGRKGSFPMEKMMAMIRKMKTKSSGPDVDLFFDTVQPHLEIIEDGIKRLVERNLGLVGHLINQFTTHERSYSREDRLQDGNAGLIKAAYRFDPSRNIKFSTYACWWIKQEARLGYMDMARTIRWPSNVYQAMGKSKEVFLASMGRNGAVVFAATCPPPMSLDEPISPDSTEPLINYLDSGSTSLDDLVQDRQLSQIIRDTINSTLTEREALVIRARYSIDQKAEHILAEIGEKLKVSPERIRKIQINAERKLKKCLLMNKNLQENYA